MTAQINQVTRMPHGSMQTIAESGALAFSCQTRIRSTGASWTAFQSLVKARCGGAAVEIALAVGVLVFTFGGLAEIVRTTCVSDTMNGAARTFALLQDGAASLGHSKRRIPAGPSSALRFQDPR